GQHCARVEVPSKRITFHNHVERTIGPKANTACNVRSGSFAPFRGHPAHVRFAPDSDRIADMPKLPKSAMWGRLRVGKKNFTSRRWSAQPCVRPISAVHMTDFF